MEHRWASMLEQRVENMVFQTQYTHYQSATNTATLQDVEEQVMTFSIFMDDDDETAQELEECTSQRFQEPLPNTSVVEESKKVKCLPENKNVYEEGELEKKKQELRGK
ncbi:hypothetical protein M9H77_36277 [Catharanthus roseus]|uniref:Uncharacterized protein n=1 Tax=Catharanthus roseus TaxID=4058 RepID=A0ACB9ZRC2_CATRO|nr:hypothetical protein M9H77_36277 [Catharanthus roseus]